MMRVPYQGDQAVDSSREAGEDYQQMILADLLYFFPEPYVMLSAYIDESGTHADSPVMCIAGVLYERAKVRQLNRKWKEALGVAGIRYFHTVECANRQGEFKGKPWGWADDFYIHLLGLIRKYASGWAVAYTLPKNEFNEFREGKWNYGQYATCAHFCMQALRLLARDQGHKTVSFAIESGHEDMGELRNLLRELRGLGHQDGPLQFADKKDLLPLQTADVFAYEAWKRVQEQSNPTPRALRKSLQSLLVSDLDIAVSFLGKRQLQEYFNRAADIMLS
jgi:hypothetical protein